MTVTAMRPVEGRGKLQREAEEIRVRVAIGFFQMPKDMRVLLLAARDLCQPDHGLDRLDLAEEGPRPLEIIVPPVLKQALRRRGHAPVVRIGNLPPAFEMSPDFVDDRVLVVGARLSSLGMEGQSRLLGRTSSPRLGNRRQIFRTPTPAERIMVKRLPLVVKAMMTGRRCIRRSEYRLFVKRFCHAATPPESTRFSCQSC